MKGFIALVVLFIAIFLLWWYFGCCCYPQYCKPKTVSVYNPLDRIYTIVRIDGVDADGTKISNLGSGTYAYPNYSFTDIKTLNEANAFYGSNVFTLIGTLLLINFNAFTAGDNDKYFYISSGSPLTATETTFFAYSATTMFTSPFSISGPAANAFPNSVLNPDTSNPPLSYTADGTVPYPGRILDLSGFTNVFNNTGYGFIYLFIYFNDV